MNKGYIHVYTGNGKGKTTAAFGLALRAVGAGKKVFIAQFVKSMKYSEVIATEMYLPNIEITQYGLDCFIINSPTEADITAAVSGLNAVEQKIQSQNYDVIILDEINIAIYYQLFTVDILLEILERRPTNVEIVITGRYADPKLIAYADLVTDMQEIKHYYQNGVASRNGIDC